MLSTYAIFFPTIICYIFCFRIWIATASASFYGTAASTTKVPDKNEWVKRCAAEYERKYRVDCETDNKQKQQTKNKEEKKHPQDESPEEYYPINYEPAFNYDKLHVSDVIIPLEIHQKDQYQTQNGPTKYQPTAEGQHVMSSATTAGKYSSSSGLASSSENEGDRWEEPRKRSRNRERDERNGRHGESEDNAAKRRYGSESDESEEESEEKRDGQGRKRSSREGSNSRDRSRSTDNEQRVDHHYESDERKESDERLGRHFVRGHHHRAHYRRPSNAPYLPQSMATRHRYHPFHRSRHYPPLFPPSMVFRPRLPLPSQLGHHQLQHQQQPGSSPPTETQHQQSAEEQQTAVEEKEQTRPAEAKIVLPDQQKEQKKQAIPKQEQQQQQKKGTDNEQQHQITSSPPTPPSTEVPKQQSSSSSPPPSSTTQSTDNGAAQRHRRPSRCVRKAVEKCSSFSRCADGTGRVQHCWHKGNDMVFDEPTQECRSFMTLPDCQRESYCVDRPFGPTPLGGVCSKVAIICGISQKQDSTDTAPFVCRGPGVLHPRNKERCVNDMMVPQCAELLS